ncbi:MAG: hypothetical protein DWQ19_12190 [Crenarchaeota archaeon]|nr:MAG: hypothetical protein DWQ19_12190 [Thermoproteota archaeon]
MNKWLKKNAVPVQMQVYFPNSGNAYSVKEAKVDAMHSNRTTHDIRLLMLLVHGEKKLLGGWQLKSEIDNEASIVRYLACDYIASNYNDLITLQNQEFYENKMLTYHDPLPSIRSIWVAKDVKKMGACQDIAYFTGYSDDEIQDSLDGLIKEFFQRKNNERN